MNELTFAWGFIQWKGSDVYIDIYCECGCHSHYDGDFLYYWECPRCHRKYKVSPKIQLFELDEKEAKKECGSEITQTVDDDGESWK